MLTPTARVPAGQRAQVRGRLANSDGQGIAGAEVRVLSSSPISPEQLARIVRENNLPPKVLVIHRFTRNMVPDAEKIQLRPEVEFVTITRFDDLDAVRSFAGEDYTRAVIAPDAQPLLSRYEERSTHYDTAFSVD